MADLTIGFSKPLCQIRPTDTPIKAYKMVQTGPKIQFGGFSDGLFNSTYQSRMEEAVAKPERKPMKRQMLMQIAILASNDLVIK